MTETQGNQRSIPEMNPSFRLSGTGGGIDFLVCVPLAEMGLPHGFSLRWRRLNASGAREPFGFPDGSHSDRGELARRLGLRNAVSMRQVHEAQVKLVTQPAPVPPVCDGLVTCGKDLALVVKTADCVPILMWDSKRNVVAAVHAGWRGTVARIARNGVKSFEECFDSDPRFLHVAMGPSIGACCYEVGDSVVRAFTESDGTSEDLFTFTFTPVTGGGIHLDLIEANRRQLVESGVPSGQIYSTGLCTACAGTILYSYRREGKGVGRLMGAIGVIS